MHVLVTAKTCAKETKATKIDEGHYHVAVTAAPVGGQANVAIIEALAEYLHIAPSRMAIKLGKTSKEKLLVIK